MGRASRMKKLRRQTVTLTCGGENGSRFEFDVDGIEVAAQLAEETMGEYCRRCGGKNAMGVAEEGQKVKFFYGCPMCDQERAEEYRLQGH